MDYSIIVLTGGKATRLSSCLDGKPKILANICGKPFLDYLLAWLKSSGANLCQVLLATGHLTSQIQDYIDKNSLNLTINCETKPLGTLGALLNCFNVIHNNHILVINGDTIFDIDFGAMFSLYLRHNSPLLAVTHYQSLNTSSGFILNPQGHAEWVLKNSTHFSLGSFFISKALLHDICSIYYPNFSDQFLMIDNDLLSLVQPLAYYTNVNYFVDIGTPSQYHKASIELPHLYPCQ